MTLPNHSFFSRPFGSEIEKKMEKREENKIACTKKNDAGLRLHDMLKLLGCITI